MLYSGIKSCRSLVGVAEILKESNHSIYCIVLGHLKRRKLDRARKRLNYIPHPYLSLCAVLIKVLSENSRFGEALELFEAMRVRDSVAWNSIIKACFDCGDLSRAVNLFDQMPTRNVVSWTTMLNGFLQYGEIKLAEDMFRAMPSKDIAVWNSMIHGYCSLGRYTDASGLFENMPCRDVISWTSMINGLEQQGKSEEALVLFLQMKRSGITPTSSTFCCVLSACGNLSALLQGVQFHVGVVKLGYSSDAFISTCLITFYAKCRDMGNSLKVFNQKLQRNVVVWTSLLTGYNLNKKYGDALHVFSNMMKMGVLPNQSSFCSAFNSCCSLEDIDRGRVIQAASIKLGFGTDTFIGNSLILLYSSCGHLADGVTAFKLIMEKNIVSWNSIVTGCARHCCSRWVLTLFGLMIRAEVDPDEITLTAILHACSTSYVTMQKGKRLFEYFTGCGFIMINDEHIACMVDMYCRSGKLEEGENWVRKIQFEKSSKVWLSLLGACGMHSNLQMAERAAGRILAMEPGCVAAYVLLCNLYASAGRWSDVSRIRGLMNERRVFKQPGSSGLGSTTIPER